MNQSLNGTAKPLDGRVAVVTGAGRGLGRSHALLLAAQGASVVVNDHGVELDGTGHDERPAHAVVEEIREAGGLAAADVGDVSTEAGGAALVDLALAEFGGVDIVVNNAGIDFDRQFVETTMADYDLLWRIHVAGSINVTRAAWPQFVKQSRGRVVMTCSTVGLMGMPGRAAYAAAKGAIHGLMRVMAIEGAEDGIKVNSIAPVAFSRLMEVAAAESASLQAMRETFPPELVSPVVAWLASDSCESTGHVYSAWSGRVSQILLGSGAGYVDRHLSAGAVADNYEAVASSQDLYVPSEASEEIGFWSGRLDLGAETSAIPSTRRDEVG